MNGFSIIICTYNPSIRLIKRLFTAINQFETDCFQVEVLLIDNNSTLQLSKHIFVQDFLSFNPTYRIIRENEPGLTSARLAGIKASKFDWLIFFDDDNEPDSDYLIHASEVINKFNFVRVWGPGKITVEFTSEPSDWLFRNKKIFQDKNEHEFRFDNKPDWQKCYPYGTGMLVQREIALSYVERVCDGRYTICDRNGKSLSSGGDVQIVLTAIEKGFQAGVAPSLKLTHLIDSKKANLKYMVKQQYGTASASILAFNQVFIKSPILLNHINNSDIFLRIYSLYRIYKKDLDKRDFKLLIASKIGEFNASVYASGQSKPLLLRFYEWMINV